MEGWKPPGKIGGITIERIPKTAPVASQNPKIPAGISLPPGITLQSPAKNQPATSQDTCEDLDHDEFDELFEGDEEEEDEEMLQKDFDDLEKAEMNNSPGKPTPPVLPSGVTLQRKVPVTATVKPNIQLPPGISLGKKSTPTQSLVTPMPRAYPAPRPPPPVRAVRPRAKLEPPRMHINDFLEQRMRIEPNFLRSPKRASARPNLPSHSRASVPSPSKIATHEQSKLSSRVSDFDSEDDLPLRPKKADSPLKTRESPIKLPPGVSLERNSPKRSPQQALPQLPPGISVEKKKPVVSASPTNNKPADAEKKISDEKTKLPIGFQLPPGISFGKFPAKFAQSENESTPASSSQEKSSEEEFGNEEIEDEEGMEEEDYGEEGMEDYAHEENEMDPEEMDEHLGEDGIPNSEEDGVGEPEEDGNEQGHDMGEEHHEELGMEEGETGELDPENEEQHPEEEEETDQQPQISNTSLPEEETEKETYGDNEYENDDGHAGEGEMNSGEYHEEGEENPEQSGEEEHNNADLLNADGDQMAGDDEMAMAGEIDFEALLAAPVIPTLNSLGQNNESISEQEKEQKEEIENLQNFMDMMTKGEIEGEMEEEDEEKRAEKRKAEEPDDDTSAKKSKPEDEDDDEEEDGESEPIDKTKVSGSHLRKNIRDVMDETKLDETTLAAQREEAERLKRLQDQQRIVREVKRQIQQAKNAEKSQNSSHVLSLLRGNSETSILKKSATVAPETSARAQDSILLKMGNGQQTCLSDRMRELLRTPGKSPTPEPSSKAFLSKGMVSSSVTIAPIKKEPIEEKKKGDVVTLSSDSDDCVVLSEEEPESEPEDDPANSGLHTSDRYNKPDEQGRVLVNVGHPPQEPDVFLAPQIARIIKPHQIGGVRFLYDNIIESVDRYESSPGFGCILAHSMGLGKTLQIVSFSDIFLRHTSGKKILCIMPINTIQNWQAEYNMWTPKENPTGGDVRCRHYDVYVVNESSKNIQSRAKVILDWHKNGGVLLMGYELFRLLSLKRPIKSKKKRPDEAEADRNRDLVEDVYSALVKPGPDLVICDEGHRIKNSHASTSQALKMIRTKRRVVLTGYPLQNNLLEYWCMVDFVRPNYLGSKTEFSNMFERPIQNGQCIDSTPQDKRLMRYRAHVLHSLLEGFVQRRSHEVLQQALPQKQEYVLLLRFTPFQRKLYTTFMDEVVRTVAVPNPLRAFAVCCKIWNHPDVLHNFLKKKGQERDLDLEEAMAPAVAPLAGGMFGMPPQPPAPWPKRGPGSRGGKVRQRKGAVALNRSITQKELPAEQPLPAMDQFPGGNYPSTSSYQPQYPPIDNTHHAGNPPFDESMFKNQFNSDPNYPGYPGYDGSNEFGQVGFEGQGNYGGQGMWGGWGNASSQGGYSSSSDEFMSPPKFEKKEDFGPPSFPEERKRVPPVKAEVEDKKEEKDGKKDEISFDWAVELFKNYVSGVVENSSKMEVFMLILHESLSRGDRLLVFSQSLLTLDLIEELLQKRRVPGRSELWQKNRNYFRLDGSTPALEREKLINEFNSTDTVHIFLVSTRAGSLGINLVGANRVVVFDASWNPCHDTQAVCRVYRYGQKKPCYVYRLVMDSCLEKKIYDRQINKQGMADRIVDELNPDAHLSLKDVTNLCWDDQEETTVTDFSEQQHKYHDDIVKLMLAKHSGLLSRAPFQHESLLIDRKEKKLSQAEKRLAKRSYELEKQAASNPRGMHHLLPGVGSRGFSKPIASVKPMQSGGYGVLPPRSKWIPAEVWQKQGMSAQEMTLPLDVVIPTNSPDKTSIVLKAGQRVMVLKSPKGIYMQLETGKIIAIRTAFKVGSAGAGTAAGSSSQGQDKTDDKSSSIASALKNNPNVTITKNSPQRQKPSFYKSSSLDKEAAALNMAATKGRVFANKARPNVPATVKKPGITIVSKLAKISGEGAPEASSSSEASTSALPPADIKPYEEKPETYPPEQVPTNTWPENNMQPEMNQEDAMTKDMADSAANEPAANKPFGPEDVKKEDGPNPWPGYHMDPYGNYYPGYPGYYAPPPGYDPYRPYPPIPPVKSEPTGGDQGTPPPAQQSVNPPPMYPPYHAPYPYPYPNYPPYPPQPNPTQSSAPPVKTEGETSGYAPPPYGPRPPYPPPPGPTPAPGFYPNYPPYPPRPYHDPNYPYPNYPYMPPTAYGYPPYHNKPPANSEGGAQSDGTQPQPQ